MKKRVIEGKISSPFGGRRDPIDGTFRVHQGVDISAPVGTAVYCPCDGVISSIYHHVAGGLTLVIRPQDDQIRFAMCHLDSVCGEVGDRVGRAAIVAYSGNSGRSTGAHLHFSVKTEGHWYAEQYVGGKFSDPSPYLEL